MDSGAYVYRDSEENEICLFLFQKLTKNQMDVALPVQDSNVSEGDYFVGIFRNGNDYLGKTVYSGIEMLMNDEDMYDLQSSYDDICKHVSDFSEEEYNKYKDFVKKHVNTFDKIKSHV